MIARKSRALAPCNIPKRVIDARRDKTDAIVRARSFRSSPDSLCCKVDPIVKTVF